jgi:hypothetical protein
MACMFVYIFSTTLCFLSFMLGDHMGHARGS